MGGGAVSQAQRSHSFFPDLKASARTRSYQRAPPHCAECCPKNASTSNHRRDNPLPLKAPQTPNTSLSKAPTAAGDSAEHTHGRRWCRLSPRPYCTTNHQISPLIRLQIVLRRVARRPEVARRVNEEAVRWGSLSGVVLASSSHDLNCWPGDAAQLVGT